MSVREGVLSQQDRIRTGQGLPSLAVARTGHWWFLFVNSIFQLTTLLACNALWKDSSGLGWIFLNVFGFWQFAFLGASLLALTGPTLSPLCM